MKVRINNRKSLNYIIIFILGIIISIPLLSKNLNIYQNNGFIDLAEGYEFSKNFQVNEGKILLSFFNYLGTGNTILESPLVKLVLVFGNYLLDSFIITYKIITFVCLIFSGIYMHKFIDKVTQNKNISLLGSLLYMSAPFHLNQIYINNSLSSSLIFVFIPMTFLGLYKMLNTTEHSYHVAIGIIGLILTDLRMAFIVGISIFIYLIINIKSWPIEHVRKSLIINFLAIITITSFFVFPFIEANTKCNYVGSNVTKDEFLNSRISIKSLFVTEDSASNIFEFGPHIIIMLAFSIMALNRLKNNRKEFIFCLLMMILYVFMSTKYFPWGIFPDFICRIENSYNFLIVAIFFETVICAINMSVVLKKFSGKDVIIISLISLIYIFALKDFIPYTNDIFEIEEYNLSEIVENKFLPKKSYENIEYLNNRSRDVEVIKGNAEIYNKNKFLTYYSFKSNTLDKDTIYELPYLYYPGYEIRYDGINLDYFESDNGLIAVKMNPEDGTYFEVNFVGTDLMNVCKIISFVSVCLFGIYVYKKR